MIVQKLYAQPRNDAVSPNVAQILLQLVSKELTLRLAKQNRILRQSSRV